MTERKGTGSLRSLTERRGTGSSCSLAAATAVLLALVACSGSNDSAAPASQSATTVAPSTTAATTAAAPTTAAPTTTASSTAAPTTTAPTTTAKPSYDFSAIARLVQAKIDEHGLNGAGLVVVDRDHGVVYEHYWGPFNADRISLVASASKMVVAGVLMHLHDAGLIDVDLPVADYVPWGKGNPKITIAQLISNTSGLVGLFEGTLPAAYRCQYVPAGTLQECAESIFTTSEDDAEVVAPDTKFRYGGAQWQVAGALAEAVTGKSWATLIDEIYTQPCGLPTLAFNNHFTQVAGSGTSYPTGFNGDPSVLKPTQNPNMEGGAYATTGDYAKLLQMYLNGGTCSTVQVLSPASIKRMTSPRTVLRPDGSTGTVGTDYGMGWWIAGERATDPGMYGAVPWLNLADGHGAYLIIEDTTAVGMEIVNELADPIKQAIDAAR